MILQHLPWPWGHPQPWLSQSGLPRAPPTLPAAQGPMSALRGRQTPPGPSDATAGPVSGSPQTCPARAWALLSQAHLLATTQPSLGPVSWSADCPIPGLALAARLCLEPHHGDTPPPATPWHPANVWTVYFSLSRGAAISLVKMTVWKGWAEDWSRHI